MKPPAPHTRTLMPFPLLMSIGILSSFFPAQTSRFSGRASTGYAAEMAAHASWHPLPPGGSGRFCRYGRLSPSVQTAAACTCSCCRRIQPCASQNGRISRAPSVACGKRPLAAGSPPAQVKALCAVAGVTARTAWGSHLRSRRRRCT